MSHPPLSPDRGAPAGPEAPVSQDGAPSTTGQSPAAAPHTAAPRAGGPAPSRSERLRPFLLDVVLPLAGYYLLRARGADTVAAYTGAVCISAAWIVVSSVRRRKLDVFGICMLVLFGVELTAALVSDDIRYALAAHSLLSALAGIALLVSRLLGRPVFAQVMARSGAPRPGSRPAGGLAGHPAAHTFAARLTTVWGVVLLVEAGTRLALLTVLTPDALMGYSRLMQLGTVAALVAWSAWYGKRLLHRAAR
ncbi:VC0807 family protein [Streptomyces sp. NPDC059740]|uniref:VC0807 family protein n=1 Tax=Streptomyces sp. NPDC059740 TaxID=3346926 RepID=UPI0036676CEA